MWRGIGLRSRTPDEELAQMAANSTSGLQVILDYNSPTPRLARVVAGAARIEENTMAQGRQPDRRGPRIRPIRPARRPGVPWEPPVQSRGGRQGRRRPAVATRWSSLAAGVVDEPERHAGPTFERPKGGGGEQGCHGAGQPRRAARAAVGRHVGLHDGKLGRR